MTVGELKERLDRDFMDDDNISFEVVLDGDNRGTYYGNESVFIKHIEYTQSHIIGRDYSILFVFYWLFKYMNLI